jgi:hypothetical protein
VTVKTLKTYTLSIPPRAGYTVVPSAVAALDGSYAVLEVMAGSLTFVTPLDLCALRALVDQTAMFCDSVFFDCPVTPDVHNYLGRMNFYKGMPPNVELSRNAPVLRRTNRKTRLIEVCRVESSDNVQRLEESVWAVAQPHFGSGPMARACVSVIAAATENVLDHAKSPVGAVVAAQSYRRTGLELAVVDLGLGIPNTLRSRSAYRGFTDIEAVERALDDGVTSTGEEGRGAGLAEIISSARRTKNSTLVIQSGHAQFTLSCSGGTTRTYSTCPGMSTPGTWISLVLKP